MKIYGKMKEVVGRGKDWTMGCKTMLDHGNWLAMQYRDCKTLKFKVEFPLLVCTF